MAAITCKPPQFELRSSPQVSTIHQEPALKAEPLVACSTGYTLSKVKDIDTGIYEVLTNITRLTEIADLSLKPWSAHTKRTLILLRNETMHDLLSINTGHIDLEKFANTERGSISSCRVALTEVIRLAAVIYSDMAILPHPWKLAVKLNHAKRLRAVWKKGQLSQLVNLPNAHLEVQIWLLWFGCFGAYLSEYQEWFETELHRMMKKKYGDRLDALTFDDVKGLLRGFLWWDEVCDWPGEELWWRIKNRAVR
jgi:hypothetical protein